MQLLLLLLVLGGCGNTDKQNNGCWLTLKELPDYRLDAYEPEYGLAASSDVVAGRFDVVADVTLVGSDSVQISGKVIDADWVEGDIYPFICVFDQVDKCINDVYKLCHDRRFFSDMKGNYSFIVERKDGLMFIINFVGFDPVLMTLNCCDDCSKNDKRHSLHVELKH